MKSIIRLEDLDPAEFIIKWRMTEMCNIKCSYCLHSVYSDGRGINKASLDEQEKRLCAVADKLNALIDGTSFNNVKIDILGGEVTLFDLEKILSYFHTDKLKRINITTNLMRDKAYYISLARFCTEHGLSLTLTASFHYEFQDIDTYFNKVVAIKDLIDIFACEMVSVEHNQELCSDFKQRCELLKVDYMIEADLRPSSKSARIKGLIAGSKKPKKGMRYKATFTDGTEGLYQTRNQFLIDATVAENSDLKFMRTEGYFCTNTSDFFYLDFDMAVGRTEKNDSCTNRMPIEDFKVLKPRRCPHTRCTLCGHMSLWK